MTEGLESKTGNNKTRTPGMGYLGKTKQPVFNRLLKETWTQTLGLDHNYEHWTPACNSQHNYKNTGNQ